MRPLAWAAAICLLMLGGCGSSNDAPVDKVFGHLSNSDRAAFKHTLTDVQRATAAHAETIAAFDHGTQRQAEARLARFTAALDAARDEVSAIANDDLRGTLNDYVARLTGVADVLERAILADPSTDQDRLLADYQRAVRRAQAGDQILIGRISKYLSADQRARLRQSVRDAAEKFKETVGG